MTDPFGFLEYVDPADAVSEPLPVDSDGYPLVELTCVICWAHGPARVMAKHDCWSGLLTRLFPDVDTTHHPSNREEP